MNIYSVFIFSLFRENSYFYQYSNYHKLIIFFSQINTKGSIKENVTQFV